MKWWSLSPIYRYSITGRSMLPFFKEGDTVIVNRLAYLFSSPHTGDVVVLKDPRTNRPILKRIEKVREDTYFVLGNNQSESTDSRTFGFVKKKSIIGKVIATTS